MSIFLLMLGASAVPGPSDMLVMREAQLRGFRGCVLTIFGIVIADTVFIFAASAGWVSLLGIFPGATRTLRWVGIGYMFWLAWRIGRPGNSDVPDNSGSGWAAGFLVTFSDPTAIGFYAAILPVMTGGNPVLLRDGVMLFFCAALAITLVKCGYAVLAVRLGKVLLRSPGNRAIGRFACFLFLVMLFAMLFLQSQPLI